MNLDQLFGVGSDDDDQSSSAFDLPSLIETKARKYNVPVNLANALIGQESGFRNDATSPKGARGLGQLMPDTAKRFGVTDPEDPEQNVDASMRYLRLLHDEFGSWEVALGGYHAGEGNVRKAGGQIPDTNDGLIDTKDYVRSIMAKAGPLDDSPSDGRSGLDVLFGVGGGENAPEAVNDANTGELRLSPIEGLDKVVENIAGRQTWYQRLPTMASKGAASMIEGIGWLVDSDAMENFGRAKKEEMEAIQMKDPEVRDALTALSEAEGFVGTLGALKDNPIAIADIVVGSAVQMLPGLPIARAASILGRVGYNAARAGGVADDVAMQVGRATAEKYAARAGAAATEGVIAGSQSGAEVEGFLIEQGMDPEQARTVAMEAMAKVSAATTIMAGFGSARLEGDLVTGNVTQSGVRGAVKNIGTPGIEEMGQEAFQEYATVTGKREGDPDQEMDLGKAAATGLVAGTATAAPLHVAGRMTASGQEAAQPEAELQVDPEEPKRPSEHITTVDANSTLQQLDSAGSIDEAIAIFQAANKADITISGGVSVDQMEKDAAIKAVGEMGLLREHLNQIPAEARSSVLQDYNIATGPEGRVPARARANAIERLHAGLSQAGLIQRATEAQQAKALEGNLEEKVAIEEASKLMGTTAFKQYAANQPENVRNAIDATSQALANTRLAEPVRAEQANRILQFAQKNGLQEQPAAATTETGQEQPVAGTPEMLAENQVKVAKASTAPEFKAALSKAGAQARATLTQAIQDVSNPQLPAGYRNVRAAAVLQFAEQNGISTGAETDTSTAPTSTAPATSTPAGAKPANPADILARANLGPQAGTVTITEPVDQGFGNKMIPVLGRALGRDVVYFSQNEHTRHIDGFVLPDSPNTIFLNANSSGSASPLAVFGHEFMHTMPQEIKKEFIDAIRPLINPDDIPRIQKYLNQPDLEDGGLFEEIGADIFGNGFNNPDLMKQALDGMPTPTAAMKLLQHVRAFIARMLEALDQMTGFDTSAMVQDLKAADAAWVKAMRQYLSREQSGTGTINGRAAKELSMEELSALVAGKTPYAEKAEAEIARRSTYEDIDAVDKVAEAAGKKSSGYVAPDVPSSPSPKKVVSPKSDLVSQQIAARRKRDSGQLLTSQEVYLADSPDVQPNPDAEITLDTQFSVERVRSEEMSTRVPTAAKATEDAMKGFLVSGFDAMKAEPASFEKNIAAVVQYPNYRQTKSANTPEKQAERFIEHAKANLLWLHDQMPEELRDRAKLWYDGAREITDRWTVEYNLKDHQIAGVIAALSPQMDWFKNVSLAGRVLDTMRDQKQFTWSAAMERKSQQIFVDPKFEPFLNEVRDRKLGELKDPYLKALWIRTYDEAHNPRSYNVLSPEGDQVGVAMTKAGAEAQVTWGSLPTIAKAVAIIENPSIANVSAMLGDAHKVRNFYNNILIPNSNNGHVTIDTHAVAAALLRPLAASSTEVLHNFSGKLGASKSAKSGSVGTYGLYAEAYRRAAAERGLLAREMQSITWEAVRGLFKPKFKNAGNVAAAEAVWNRFKKGQDSHETARQEIIRLAGGIDLPNWDGPAAVADEEEGASVDTGDVSGVGVPGRDSANDTGTGVVTSRAVQSVARNEVSLSAATDSIPGLRVLTEAANNGDDKAAELVQDIAFDNLRHLLQGRADIQVNRATGLFEGSAEPSARLSLSFDEADRGPVLAALAKFARNFNQKQVHVRQETADRPGTKYDDGSYVTNVYRWNLRAPLSRKQVQSVIDQSGLYGLTFGNNFVEAYYVGDPEDAVAIEQFERNIQIAADLIGAVGGEIGRSAERLWPYGEGEGTIGYENIAGDVPSGEGQSVVTAKRVAEYLNDGPVRTFDQAPSITPEQERIQSEIADVYDELPLNDLSNPNVKKAYDELAKELSRQYEALPVKVEVLKGQGEPYKNSAEMRKDILDNNHLFIFGTGIDTFGPEGSDFSGHPLLEYSGIVDVNGEPLLMNDLLRAVHDYFAHGMTPAQFGPKGEEAAWKNHMASIDNPWARWALTMETRAQNSWVNFRKDLDPSTPIKDRQFADQKVGLLPIQYSLTGDAKVDEPMVKLMEVLSDEDKQGTLRYKPVFSTARALGTLTPAQAAAAENVLGKPKTVSERAREFRADWKKNLVQGIFDQFAPIKELSHKAYVMSRMTKGGDSTLEALLLYGKVFVDDEGFYDVEYSKSTGMQGFARTMQKLDGEHDRFLLWVAAQRAQQLKDIGLENLFSDSDIAALKTLNQGQTSSGKSREVAYAQGLKEMMEFNKSVLTIAEKSGLIDSATRDMYEKTPYVPFYRLQEDGVQGFGVSSGLVNQEAWKRLKGGTAKLNEDLLANMLHNWSHLITASAKNRAAKETLTQAERLGIAQKVPVGSSGKALARFKEAGRDVTYMVGDEHLLDAILGLESSSLGAWAKPFVTMKRALTFGVTVNPTFKIRNLMRDTISAIGTAELSYNPIENIGKGWGATAKDSETRASMLAAGGMIRFGSVLDGQDASAARRIFERDMPANILNNSDKSNAVVKQLSRAFDVYQEFTDRGEQVNRAALYQRMLAKGMSHGEAAFWARDLMDFSNHGKWTAVRTLSQLVPFMNARLQGMYKLGRAAANDWRRFGTTAGAVALASIGLMLAYKDDEDFKKREDWDRQNYWWFKIGDTAFRIPKPFEIGSIGTLAELGLQAFIDDEMDGERFAENMKAIVGNQLAMNPVPQAVKPIIDLYANRDSFTGRPIENMAMGRLQVEDRYSPQTSDVARLVGEVGMLSPVQVDHLTRAYFGWLGTMATTVIDYGIRPMVGDRGERPAMQLRDVFLAGNFAESLPSASSRYVTQMYEQAQEIEQQYMSYRNAQKLGNVERADEIIQENPSLASEYKAVTRLTREQSRINRLMQQVSNSRSLSAETKRQMLDNLAAQRDRLARTLSSSE